MARIMLSRAPDNRLESPGRRHVADKHLTTVIERNLQASRHARDSNQNCLIMFTPNALLFLRNLHRLRVHQLIRDFHINVCSVTSVKRPVRISDRWKFFSLFFICCLIIVLSVIDSWQIFNDR